MFLNLDLCCEVKASCPHMEPGLAGGVASVGVFLKDLSPYLCQFGGKPRKTPNGKVEKRDR